MGRGPRDNIERAIDEDIRERTPGVGLARTEGLVLDVGTQDILYT